nr:helix-turn-helix domain-containing protein [Desulfobacula sp.]
MQHEIKIQFLNTKKTAAVLGVKDNTLEIWRHRGIGPKFVKIGGAVRYRIGDLEAYIEAQTRTCTSQSGDSISHVN